MASHVAIYKKNCSVIEGKQNISLLDKLEDKKMENRSAARVYNAGLRSHRL